MLKRTLSFLLSVFLVLLPIPSQALAPGYAFDNLMSGTTVTTNGSGHFETSARNIYTMGGVDVNFKRVSNVSMISITPPSWSAGCGGIDAHFGGFSFISGAQISSMIQQITQGAVGMVVHLVLKNLCPICEAVLGLMEHLAQMASKYAMDSCAIGQELAKRFTGLDTKVDSHGAQSICGRTVSGSGLGADFLSTQGDLCSNLDKSLNEMGKKIKELVGLSGPATTAQDAAKEGQARNTVGKDAIQTGNLTWRVLSAMYGHTGNGVVNPSELDGTIGDAETIRTKLILMNMIGTTIVKGNNEGNDGQTAAGKYYKPLLPPKYLYSIVMCGAITKQQAITLTTTTGTTGAQAQQSVMGLNQSPLAIEYCKNDYGLQAVVITGDAGIKANGLKLYDCANNDYATCLTLTDPSEDTFNKIVSGPGMITKVDNVMRAALEAVLNNEDLRTKRTTDGTEVFKFIAELPYPIYQVLNIASIYPAVAAEVLNTTTRLVAETLTARYLEEFISKLPKNVVTTNSDIDGDMFRGAAEALTGFRVVIRENRQSMSQLMEMQNLLNIQVRELNKAIQQKVMMTELSGNESYASDIMKTLAAERGTARTSSRP